MHFNTMIITLGINNNCTHEHKIPTQKFSPGQPMSETSVLLSQDSHFKDCLPGLSPSGASIHRMTILTSDAVCHLCPVTLTPMWLWIFPSHCLYLIATVALIIFTNS